MRIPAKIVGSAIAMALGVLLSAAPAVADCISIAGLLTKTQEKYPTVTMVKEITGVGAAAFAAAASRETGQDLDADEIGFFTSPEMSPAMLLIFATKGCARDVVIFTPTGGGNG